MNILPFGDEITNAKLAEIKQFPELILEISKWRCAHLCYYCLNEIPNDSECLMSWIGTSRYNALSMKCPNCRIQVSMSFRKVKNNTVYDTKGLSHYIVRRREITTGYKKLGWFRKTPITFTETQLIKDNSRENKNTSEAPN